MVISRFKVKPLRLLILTSFLLAGLLMYTGMAAAASYTVQPGDTLYLIGQRHDVSAWELQQANNLNSTMIYPGQTLWIPDRSGNTYIVQPGDSLYLIGQRYGVSAWELQQANNLSSTMIYVGQRLTIPGHGQSGNATTHVVQRGDTLYLISQRYGLSVAQLKAFNGLTSNDIYPGQTLRLTSSGSSNSREEPPSENAADLDMLARVVYGEARGEPYAGQVAVAAVVLNRVRDSRFPNTISGVIYDVDAFTSVNDGQFYLTPNSTAYQAAREALRGSDPSGGALYFWNAAEVPSGQWVWTRTIITTIGKHVFAI
jgi:N-acetylmuramoyl-L-alanine amidase